MFAQRQPLAEKLEDLLQRPLERWASRDTQQILLDVGADLFSQCLLSNQVYPPSP